jgi:diguanylate cyclase (GGDEF)-like protein
MLLARRGEHTELNVTMIDIDDFKRLNDTRGHAAGDEALVGIGAELIQYSGAEAVVGRLGGEEFIIADTASAERHAETVERIRLGIAALPVHITASLGTCGTEIGPGAAADPPEFLDQLIRAADLAMYRSKRAGGNRTHRSDATAASP